MIRAIFNIFCFLVILGIIGQLTMGRSGCSCLKKGAPVPSPTSISPNEQMPEPRRVTPSRASVAHVTDVELAHDVSEQVFIELTIEGNIEKIRYDFDDITLIEDERNAYEWLTASQLTAPLGPITIAGSSRNSVMKKIKNIISSNR